MKLSQRQIVAGIEPVDGSLTANHPKFDNFYFAQVSGGEVTASVEKIYLGGKNFPEVLCAPAEIGDITLTAHFDDATNGMDSKLARLRDLVGQAYYNITVSTLDCGIKVTGSSRIYSKSLLVGLTEPDGDASSGAPATFALTFSVQTVTAGTGRTTVTA
jgi:hypothetical protein